VNLWVIFPRYCPGASPEGFTETCQVCGPEAVEAVADEIETESQLMPETVLGSKLAVIDPPPVLTEGRRASRFSITNHLKAKPQDFQQLDVILKLVQEKKFQVVIGKTFPLAETRAAQRYLEGREHFGKVMLTM